MKVMQIVPVLNYGGIESHRYMIAKYHDPQSYELMFCCLKDQGMISEKIEALGYPVIYLNQDVKIPNFKLILVLYRLFKKENPDIVHACASEANFHAVIAAYLARTPVRIAEEIGIPRQSKKAKVIFRGVYALSTAVIGVSKKVQEYLIGENKVPPRKVKLIYNPYDIERYKEYSNHLNTKKSVINIIGVGRLVEEKNFRMLINAFAEVHKKHPELSLTIVGDGPLKASLQNQISSLKMQDDIHLSGFREDIPALLQKSDLFILPSKSEGLSIALIEAMAMGMLVIGTDVGGIPDVIGKNRSMGWLVPNDDAESMSKAIEEVICLSTEEKNTISYNAKRGVVEKFSPYKYMETLDDFYKKLRHE